MAHDITHLIERHRKEMACINSEQKKAQQQREEKLKKLEKLTQEAMRLNAKQFHKELSEDASGM